MRSLFIATALALAACQCGGPVAQNRPPAVQILSPADGATLDGRNPVLLSGTATDPEDGILSGAQLLWSSDLQGPLGSGTLLSVTLRQGTHRLSLDATDSLGLSGREQITVSVGAVQNTPPQVAIDSPMDGAYFDQGQPIALVGHGSDAQDGTLAGSSLTWTSNLAGLIGSGATVTLTGAALGDHRIVLTGSDSEGLSAQATLTLHVVPPGTNRPPAVTVTSPMHGAQFTTGAMVLLSGSATDPEDGALSGTALAWRSDVDGPLGTGAMVTVSTLTNGVHVLTLTATDSASATGSASVTISVNPPNNAPPTATITAPMNGLTVFAGTPITFSGTGIDPEDGALAGMALAWRSDKDGALGTGSPLVLSTLSANTHQVRLTVTDSVGATGIATVQVNVLPMNQAPTVTLTSPMNGATFTQGNTVQLRGNATDPEDGALTGASLTWTSSRDGTLGNGASLDTASLTAGSHTLTLTAVDSGGRTGTASVAITVNMAPVMLPPVANLTGPSMGDTGVALTFSGAASTDPDGTIVSYQFDFGDGTAPQTGASATAQHAYATPGMRTVTLTVRDNDNLTGTATLPVVITQAIRVPIVVRDIPQTLGSMCQLAARGGELHVAFREEDHPSLFYGRFAQGAWTFELVDGMGFNNGGLVGTRFSMEVDAAGAPHFAYYLEAKGLYYATRLPTGWLREKADSAALPPYDTRVSIALDPANGGRPVIAYTASSGGQRIAIAVRTSAGAWTVTLQDLSPFYTTEALQGDLVIDAAGAMYIPWFSQQVTQVTGASTVNGSVTLQGSAGSWYSAALRMPGTLAVITGGGVVDITLAAPFTASTAQLSLVESFTTSQHAVAADAMGRPRIAVNHGSDLERVEVDASGFWSRLSLGPVDPAGIDVAVEGAGDTRVCFFRNGNLLVY